MSTDKPLISYLLLTFNQEQYIRESLESALAQTYSPMEIILTDDCSSDGTFRIAKEVASAYRGPHRIVLNRNERNIGIIPHMNVAVSLASGEMLIGGAGDDISEPHRVQRVYEAWQTAGGGACSIFSDAVIIDENGTPSGRMFRKGRPKYSTTPEEALATGRGGVAGCTHSYSRAGFDIFGPIDQTVKAEDMVIPFRNLLLGRIVYIDEPLVRYRVHGGNVSIGRPGRPTRETRHRAQIQLESVLLNWLKDVRTAQEKGLLDRERGDELALGIFQRLYLCGFEKRCYRQGLGDAFVGVLREIVTPGRVGSLFNILERRRRCSDK